MPDNSNQPQADDAVLGGQIPIPIGSAVLGGIEGVKIRLHSAIEEQRIAALKDAIKYVEAGLDLVIHAFQDESLQVGEAAYLLLRERVEPRVKKALREYDPWQFFECLHTHTYDCYTSSCSYFAISPNGCITGEVFKILETIEDASGTYSIAISTNNHTLVRGSEDNTIKVWNLLTGALIRTLEGHSSYITSVAISPDGQTLVSGSEDGSIKVWNLQNGELIRTLQGHSDEVNSVAISPNGQTLVSGSDDYTIKVWNLRTGELKRTLEEHSEGVYCVAISTDGQTLISGSYDCTIKVWGMP